MKILITGGAGYIGSILVPALLQERHEVTVIDNLMYRQASLLDVCADSEFSFCSWRCQRFFSIKLEIGMHDVIIPLAAIVGAPACNRDQELATQINYEAVKALSSYVSSQQILLFPVTNSGYGIGQNGIYCDENTPLNPISLYGKDKVEAEKVLLDSGNAVTFRLATVFGSSPRMRMDLLVNDFVYRALRDRFIVLFESHFKRNYIHIRDIANVFIFSIKNYEKMMAQPYNVGIE